MSHLEEQPLFAGAPDARGPTEPPGSSGASTFDPQFFQAQYGPDPQLLRKMLVAFLDAGPPMLEEMRRNSASGNFNELERVTHTLKGSLSYFTGEGCFLTVTEANQALRLGEAPRACALLPRLEVELERFIADVRRALPPPP